MISGNWDPIIEGKINKIQFLFFFQTLSEHSGGVFYIAPTVCPICYDAILVDPRDIVPI